MPFAAYIICSATIDRYSAGHAENPALRLEQDHNGGRNNSTKAGWEERVDLCELYPLLVHVNLFGGGYAEQVQKGLKRYV